MDWGVILLFTAGFILGRTHPLTRNCAEYGRSVVILVVSSRARMTSVTQLLPDMTDAYASSLFANRTKRSVCYPRSRHATPWTIRRCVMRRTKGDKVSVEIFENPEAHAWLQQMNKLMETLVPQILTQTQRQWLPIFTPEDHTLHLKVKETRMFEDLPEVGADVDITFNINCAWFNDRLIGVSMKLVSIRPHAAV